MFRTYPSEDGGTEYLQVNYTGRVQGDIAPNAELRETRWIARGEIDSFEFCPECKERILDFWDSPVGRSSDWNPGGNRYLENGV